MENWENLQLCSVLKVFSQNFNKKYKVKDSKSFDFICNSCKLLIYLINKHKIKFLDNHDGRQDFIVDNHMRIILKKLAFRKTVNSLRREVIINELIYSPELITLSKDTTKAALKQEGWDYFIQWKGMYDENPLNRIYEYKKTSFTDEELINKIQKIPCGSSLYNYIAISIVVNEAKRRYIEKYKNTLTDLPLSAKILYGLLELIDPEKFSENGGVGLLEE